MIFFVLLFLNFHCQWKVENLIYILFVRILVKEKTKNVKNFHISRHSNAAEAFKGVNSVDD